MIPMISANTSNSQKADRVREHERQVTNIRYPAPYISGAGRVLILGIAIFSVTAALSHSVKAFDLSGTAWEDTAYEFGLDPYLLYAVALVESRKYSEGEIAPYPLAVAAGGRTYYPPDRDDAIRIVRKHWITGDNVAIGLMQISVKDHGSHVYDVATLFDPLENLRFGAGVLVEGLQTDHPEMAVRIGKYNAWRREDVARAYGLRVLEVCRRLLGLARMPPFPSSTTLRTSKGATGSVSGDKSGRMGADRVKDERKEATPKEAPLIKEAQRGRAKLGLGLAMGTSICEGATWRRAADRPALRPILPEERPQSIGHGDVSRIVPRNDRAVLRHALPAERMASGGLLKPGDGALPDSAGERRRAPGAEP